MSNKISQHFTEAEATCHCGNCKYVAVAPFLLFIMEDVRAHFGVPINPSCMVRCEYWNKHEGSTATNSRHLPQFADACDMHSSIDPETVFNYIDSKYGDWVGLHAYSWGVHLDTRGYKARW